MLRIFLNPQIHLRIGSFQAPTMPGQGPCSMYLKWRKNLLQGMLWATGKAWVCTWDGFQKSSARFSKWGPPDTYPQLYITGAAHIRKPTFRILIFQEVLRSVGPCLSPLDSANALSASHVYLVVEPRKLTYILLIEH